MKKMFLLTISLLLITNVFFLSVKANNLERIAMLNTAEEEEEGFDCWAKTLYHPGARILECNYPCCYRNDWRDNDSEPHGKCKVLEDPPPSQSMLSEIGFGECGDENSF